MPFILIWLKIKTNLIKLILNTFISINLIPAGGGGGENPPPKVFFHDSKTPWDIENKLSDFDFTPLTVILRILSITILIRCCHSNLLFTVCQVIFGIEKKQTRIVLR